MKYALTSIFNAHRYYAQENRINQVVGALRRKFLSSNNWANRVKMIDAIRGLYYIFGVSRVKNDGLVFRLHAITTTMILMFSLIISSKQVVGNPIECVHTRDIPVEAFNAYCWIHSTYFMTGAMLGVARANAAFPGVAPSLGNFYHELGRTHQEDGRRINDQPLVKRVKYYQWVVFVLTFQVCAVMDN